MPKKSFNQALDEHLHILIAQGNHEAFIKLRRRYYNHAKTLCNNLAYQYSDSGIDRNELLAVCDNLFITVIFKYVAGRASFYTFWKEITTQSLIDYIMENSYECGAYMFKGYVSFDQDYDDRYTYSEYLGEYSHDMKVEKKIMEIRYLLKKYAVFFTFQETALLNLILQGYTIRELEHTGLLSKSQLYLTYKSAVSKLKNYIDKEGM